MTTNDRVTEKANSGSMHKENKKQTVELIGFEGDRNKLA